MNKTKILAVAAGFLAAAGLTTAGNIYVGSEDVGDFTGNVTVTGNGDIRFQSATINGTTSGDTSGSTNDCNGDSDATYNETTQQCECSTGTWNGFQCEVDSGSNTGSGGTGTDVPADCSNVPTAGTRGGTWTSFSKFPWETGERDKFKIGANKYMAVKFTAPAADKAGYIITVAASHAPSALHSIAISRCPGDFSQELGTGVCRKESANHSFWWSTFGQYASTTCELVPGDTYYMNVKYAKLNSLSDSTCDFAQCGQLLSWSNY